MIQIKINYKQIWEIQVPDLPMQEIKLTGKYTRARLNYLKDTKPDTYMKLLTSDLLKDHLRDIQQEAEELEELLMEQLLKSERNEIPDKATAQMEWVGYMNNLKNRVQEMVLAQVIYN